MIKWNLINPSDAVTFETDDFEVAALVTVLLGSGQYGAQEIEGDRKVPIMLFGGGDFFKEKFNREPEESINYVIEHYADELIRTLRSVAYVNKRSSLNNIGARAVKLAEHFEDKTQELPTAPKQVF